MLQRYIGNKNVLIDAILDSVGRLAKPGEIVCDAFSGSVAVSVALKRNGYRVAANDINLLSWVYAVAYLKNSKLPCVDMPLLRGSGRRRKGSPIGSKDWQELLSLLIAPRSNSIPRREWRTDFFDHYCEVGRKSAFRS